MTIYDICNMYNEQTRQIITAILATSISMINNYYEEIHGKCNPKVLPYLRALALTIPQTEATAKKQF